MKGFFDAQIKGLKKGTCTQKLATILHPPSPLKIKTGGCLLLSQVTSQRFLLIRCKWPHSVQNQQENHCFVGLLFSLLAEK